MFYVIFYQKQFKFMHVMTNYAYYKREKVKPESVTIFC